MICRAEVWELRGAPRVGGTVFVPMVSGLTQVILATNKTRHRFLLTASTSTNRGRRRKREREGHSTSQESEEDRKSGPSQTVQSD